jgi:APA family basic amino acid/polyamine antiporter
VTGLLILGTRESATVNAFLVLIKVAALVLFSSFLAIPVINGEKLRALRSRTASSTGAASASASPAPAASTFFAYVGFDAVATAAEETKNPQRNIPIGLIGSLAICTVFYLLAAAGAVGAIGAQPVSDASGVPLSPGSEAAIRN